MVTASSGSCYYTQSLWAAVFGGGNLRVQRVLPLGALMMEGSPSYTTQRKWMPIKHRAAGLTEYRVFAKQMELDAIQRVF